MALFLVFLATYNKEILLCFDKGSTMTLRSKPTELPQGKDLDVILGEESKREPRTPEHFVDFFLFEKWLRFSGIDPASFLGIENPDEVLEFGSQIQQQVVEATLRARDKEVFEEITQYLGEEDELLPLVDLVFVFGSKSTVRIAKAVELFKNGRARAIWISGRHPIYEENKLPEALVLANWAMSHGVPKDRIYVEPFSISIPDNVKTSLNLMEALRLKINSMVSVISWFAQRRAWGHFRKFAPENLKIYRVNAPSLSPELFPQNWFNTEKGIKIVFNEFIKMRVAYLLDTI